MTAALVGIICLAVGFCAGSWWEWRIWYRRGVLPKWNGDMYSFPNGTVVWFPSASAPPPHIVRDGIVKVSDGHENS